LNAYAANDQKTKTPGMETSPAFLFLGSDGDR